MYAVKSSGPLGRLGVVMEESVAKEARVRNPRGQGDRLREVLLDAAIELLADLEDVQALSVRAVTARAGVSATALYLQFADKEDLIAAVKERCFDELRSYLQAGAAETDEPRGQLAAMGRAYLQFAQERTGYYRVLFHTRHGEPDSKPIADPLSAVVPGWPQGAAMAFGDLVNAVARCLAPDTPAEGVATMIWAGLHGYVGLRRSIRHYPFPPPTEYVARLIDAHLDGVGMCRCGPVAAR
jgi:AcrR family transcriptional regulator